MKVVPPERARWRDAASSVAPIARYWRSLRPCLAPTHRAQIDERHYETSSDMEQKVKGSGLG